MGEYAPPCKAPSMQCPKQIKIYPEGMTQVYCCDGECTNVEANHK